ncbi:MAG: pentapeptide repeat-containing protein [Erysipelotrichaceae bacterium]
MNRPQSISQLESIIKLRDHYQDYIDDLRVNTCIIRNEVISNYEFKHFEFKKVLFDNCIMDHCTFDSSSFVDVEFNHCDLSNSSFKQTYFERCEFVLCKGIGMDWSKSNIKHVKFSQSNLQYTFFEYSKFADILFEYANLSDTSFSECTLKNFDVNDSKFIQTNFFKTGLKGIDFSRCEFSHPVVSSQLTELKGIVLNPVQALNLVSLIGIVVKED